MCNAAVLIVRVLCVLSCVFCLFVVVLETVLPVFVVLLFVLLSVVLYRRRRRHQAVHKIAMEQQHQTHVECELTPSPCNTLTPQQLQQAQTQSKHMDMDREHCINIPGEIDSAAATSVPVPVLHAYAVVAV